MLTNFRTPRYATGCCRRILKPASVWESLQRGQWQEERMPDTKTTHMANYPSSNFFSLIKLVASKSQLSMVQSANTHRKQSESHTCSYMHRLPMVQTCTDCPLCKHASQIVQTCTKIWYRSQRVYFSDGNSGRDLFQIYTSMHRNGQTQTLRWDPRWVGRQSS